MSVRDSQVTISDIAGLECLNASYPGLALGRGLPLATLDKDLLKAAKARKLIRRHDSILLTDAVLVEAIWTLTGKRYNLDKDDICQVISHLFEEPAGC